MKILFNGMTPENEKINIQLSMDNVIDFSPLKGGGHVAEVKDDATIKKLFAVGGVEYKGNANLAAVKEEAKVEVSAEVSPAEAVATTAEKAKKPAAQKASKKKNSKPPKKN